MTTCKSWSHESTAHVGFAFFPQLMVHDNDEMLSSDDETDDASVTHRSLAALRSFHTKATPSYK